MKMITYSASQHINRMKKRKFIALFVILIYVGFVYGQEEKDYPFGENKIEQQREWIKDNLGVQIVGGNFNYNQETNTLEISQGSSARIPDSFKGNVIVKSGGGVDIPNNFVGDVKVEGGTVKFANGLVFVGDGSYSKETELKIKDGRLNGVRILDGSSIAYNGNEITGIAGKNFRIGNDLIKVGENTRFFYKLEGAQVKLTLVGKPTETTLPNANIKIIGLKAYLGDMELNLPYSEIYLKQGDSINIEGLASPLIAKGKIVRLFFERDDINTIKPVLRRRFEDLKNAVSISDVFEKAGYGKDNKIARGEWYYSMYGEDYSLIGNRDQNIKALNDLKSGKVELYYNDEDSNVVITKTNKESGSTKSVSKFNTDIGQQKTYIKKGDLNEIETNLKNDPSLLIYIERKSSEQSIDKNKVLAILSAESHIDVEAECNQESCGPAQMSPIAVRELNRRANIINNQLGYKKEKDNWGWEDVRDNPLVNIDASIKFLSYLEEDFNGDLSLMAAGYNAGPTKVKKLGRIPKNSITRHFVGRVSDYYRYFSNKPK